MILPFLKGIKEQTLCYHGFPQKPIYRHGQLTVYKYKHWIKIKLFLCELLVQ